MLVKAVVYHHALPKMKGLSVAGLHHLLEPSVLFCSSPSVMLSLFPFISHLEVRRKGDIVSNS
ncbi:hypothetical protein YC2023_036273 [Brassica napus]